MTAVATYARELTEHCRGLDERRARAFLVVARLLAATGMHGADAIGGAARAIVDGATDADIAEMVEDGPGEAQYDASGKPCEQGQTAARTGCTPAGDEGGEFKPRLRPIGHHGTDPVSQAQADALDDMQILAARAYSKGSDKAINDALRATGKPPKGGPPREKGQPPPLSYAETFEMVQEAATQKLPKPMEVFRGIGFSSGEEREAFLAAAYKAAQTGGTLTFPGFVSTSADPETAQEFAARNGPAGVLMRVQAKTGLYMDRNPDLTEFTEDELVQRHGSQYRVVGLRSRDLSRYGMGGGNVTVLDLEEIG